MAVLVGLLMLLLKIALVRSIVYYAFLKLNPVRRAGVYSEPGRWFLFKYALFAAVLMFRRAFGSDKSSAGYGVKSKSNEGQMERVQSLETPEAVDAVYFNGADKAGNYLIASTARRPNGVVQTVLMLRLPGYGILKLPTLPETLLVEDATESFAAGGLSIRCVSAMKEWHITYNGVLQDDRGASYQAHMNMIWTSYYDHFDFDTDMSIEATARAIAREPWSRLFFQRLRSSHQTHYEQFGHLRGTIVLDRTEIPLHLRGVRDHSYGRRRDWHDFHRYAMQFASLEDGTCFNASVLSMPRTLSVFEFGFIIERSGQKYPIDWCDIPMQTYGEDGKPVDKFSYSFGAGGKVYNVNVEIVESPIFYMGIEWEAKVFEQMAIYSVNGIRGWGFSEWEYRNLSGKPM